MSAIAAAMPCTYSIILAAVPQAGSRDSFHRCCHKWLLVFIFTYSPSYLRAHKCVCVCAYCIHVHTCVFITYLSLYAIGIYKYVCVYIHMYKIPIYIYAHIEKQVNTFDIFNLISLLAIVINVGTGLERNCGMHRRLGCLQPEHLCLYIHTGSEMS